MNCIVKRLFIFSLLVSFVDVYADSSGDRVLGKLKSESERCMECHGENGISVSETIPNHAGQLQNYLIKQLMDFQSGNRHHQTMNMMASELSQNDREDISAYFSSLKNDSSSPDTNVLYKLGKELYSNGNSDRNIPACLKCHGADAKGGSENGVIYPRLAGQRRMYLSAQLLKWKIAERVNSLDGVMNKIAENLTDDEMDSLAYYLSKL